MRHLLIAIVFIISATSTAFAATGDATKGKAKAAMCFACHGPKGISSTDIWPNLKGQKFGYLVKQIKAFKAKTRKEPMMEPMVKNLSDQDINDIAAFFSSL